jgi:hypothetical protein
VRAFNLKKAEKGAMRTHWSNLQVLPAQWNRVKNGYFSKDKLYGSIKPWSKIFEPDPLRTLLLECGVSDPEAVAEPGWHRLLAPEDWWTIVLGTGYRSTVDALSPLNRERVRTASIAGVRRADIQQIRTMSCTL